MGKPESLTLEASLAHARTFTNRRLRFLTGPLHWGSNRRAESLPPSDNVLGHLKQIENSARSKEIMTPSEIAIAIKLAQERGIVSSLYTQSLAAIRRAAPTALA